MGRALGGTAETLVCSERTLRRYINEGTLRGRRLDGYRFELPEQEERYAREHWELLRGLRATLRTERNVRLAVLFGSTATGEDGEGSDVDLLVAHRGGDERAFAGLRRRLSDALGRRVHLIQLDEARRSPNLLADALIEGRVVVDRNNIWTGLLSEGEHILERAARDDAQMLALAYASVDAAGRRMER